MGLFVRKVRTASGATAVQIAHTKRGVQTIVEHVGSAHDEAQLAALEAVAKQKISGGQLMLDFDDLESNRTVSTPTVTGSSARVLWQTLEDAYQLLGFDAVGDVVFKKLVLARIIEPVSKADTIRVLEEIGVSAPSLRTIWRTLARCQEHDWRQTVTDAAYRHATQDGALRLCLYDVTTLYFQAENEDEFREVGMSKERRVDPQIVVGMLTTASGFPLDVQSFTGNTAETRTLIPVLESFRDRHGVDDLVVVADAGMLSASNLNALEDAGLSFIVGSRISKAPYDLADHFHCHGTFFRDGQTLESSRVMGSGSNARERRIVYHYSFKREKRDNRTLNKQIERAQKVADGTRPVKKDRFVNLTGKRPGVDWARVEHARQLLGLKGYVSNIDATVLDGRAIVAAYHELFQVEASFRMAKTDLKARPMFHHQRDSIDAHLTIVFTALAVSRHLHAVTGASIRKIIQTLRPLRDITINVGGHQLTAATPPGPQAQEILNALNQPDNHND